MKFTTSRTSGTHNSDFSEARRTLSASVYFSGIAYATTRIRADLAIR